MLGWVDEDCTQTLLGMLLKYLQLQGIEEDENITAA
jgi:hypothetical protein